MSDWFQMGKELARAYSQNATADKILQERREAILLLKRVIAEDRLMVAADIRAFLENVK